MRNQILDDILRLKLNLGELLDTQNLIFETARDLLKAELKNYIKQKLESHPELQKELRDALGMYYEAKLKELYATLKLAKASAKLGLELLPEEMRDKLGTEFELELGKLLEKLL